MGTKRYYYCLINILFINLVNSNGQFGHGNNAYILSNQFNPPNNILNSIGLNQKGLTSNYVSSLSNTAADSNTLQYTNNCEGNTIENTQPTDGKITLKNLRFLNANERVLTNPSQISEVAALSNPGTASSLAPYFVNNRLVNSAFNNFGHNSFETKPQNEIIQQINQANGPPLSNQGFVENQALQYPTNNLINQGQFSNLQPSSYFHQNAAAVQSQQPTVHQNMPNINSQPQPLDYNQHNIVYNQQGNPVIQSHLGGSDQKLGTIQYSNQINQANEIQYSKQINQANERTPVNQLSSIQQQAGLQIHNQAATPQTLGLQISQQPPTSNYNQPAPTQQKNAFVIQQQDPPQNFNIQQGLEQPALTVSNPSTVFQIQPSNSIFPNNQGQLQQEQNHQAVQSQPTVRYLPASILKAIEELKPTQGNIPMIVFDAPKQNPNIIQEAQPNQQLQAIPKQQLTQPNQNQPIIILRTQEPQSSQPILSLPQQSPTKQNQPFIILQTQQPSSMPQQPTYNFVDSFSQPIQQNTQQEQLQSAMLLAPQHQQFPQYDYTPSPGLPSTHQPSKSSNLKVLLPLLMNLLKDRHNDGYRQCNNCGCYRPPESYIGEYNKHNDYSDETTGTERRETKSKYSKSKESSEEIIEKESEEHIEDNEEE